MSLKSGDLVRVDAGRWRDRLGTFVRYHHNPGGMRQQPQLYPVVHLAARGRAQERIVRVLTVTKEPT